MDCQKISAIEPATGNRGAVALHIRDQGAWDSYRFAQPGDIHAYFIPLHADEVQLQMYAERLSASEMERADRFLFDSDRMRYIVSHGALRELVGAYAGIPPGKADYHVSPHGKPFLAAPQKGSRVEFNMSHSGDVALIAFSTGGPIGVDVECVKEETELEQLAQACLSPDEITLLEETPVQARVETVYRWWTRKEALAKAMGSGLTNDFTSRRVLPPYPAGAAGRPAGVGSWCFWDISPASGYVATLVAEGPERSVVLMDFKPKSACT